MVARAVLPRKRVRFNQPNEFTRSRSAGTCQYPAFPFTLYSLIIISARTLTAGVITFGAARERNADVSPLAVASNEHGPGAYLDASTKL